MRKLVVATTVALALAASPALAADFSVTPAADFSAYVINGASNPTLPLIRGKAMHGTLSITNAPVVPSGGLLTRGLVGAVLGALGYVVLGRLRRALARVRLPA